MSEKKRTAQENQTAGKSLKTNQKETASHRSPENLPETDLMGRIWPLLQQENTTLVTDFDKTLTTSGSSLNSVVHLLGKDSDFAKERDALFQTYGWCRTEPPERREEAAKAAEQWWTAQLELFLSFDVSEEILEQTARLLPPREELLLLLKKCEKNKKNIWIVSSGLENVIQYWLKEQQISTKQIRILANRLFYKEGHPIGYGNLITDWNKKEQFQAEWKARSRAGYPVFLGDRPGDLDLAEPGISFLIHQADAGIQKNKTYEKKSMYFSESML